jgi:branched-chain amino acid transport system permease protein
MEQFIQLLVYGVSIGSVYALIALGFSLVFQTTGLLNFAHHEVMMVGGLIGYSLLNYAGLPIAVTILVAIVICGAISLAIQRYVVARVQRNGGGELNIVVATIGIAIIITSLAMLIWGAYPLPYPEVQRSAPLKIGQIIVDPKYLLILAISLASMLVLQVFLKASRFGLAMRATAADAATAALSGIPATRMFALAFTISGGLAAIAGVLVGMLYYASFDMGTIGLKALTAAVIGGFGSLPGAVLGGLALGILETYGTIYLSSDFNNALAFVMLIVVLLIRPSGLVGIKAREV